MQLFTIGYEGADIDSFIDTLERAKVTHVIDIRDLPASRRRDFSKNILRQHLAEVDISYSHYKALGDPKPGREAMRGGNVELFLSIFSDHISKAEAQNALQDVGKIVAEEVCALLCFERDPKHCHRTIVAKELERRAALKTWHLGVQPISKKSKPQADNLAAIC
jgi:uncharacterized protein (DUF488 family)